MKLKNILRVSGLLAMSGSLMMSCNDQWDDHTQIKEKELSGNVYDAIVSNADLSIFSKMLVETGYDKVLAGNKTYTVFAPDNNALQEYDAWGTVEDSLMHRDIVRNHIALLAYRAEELESNLMMVNGKSLLLESVQLGDEETLCANGILRIASNVVLPKDNLYEIISKEKDNYEMAAIIYNAGDSVMDPTKSIQLGVDATTGLPVYDTIWMYQNPYLDSIAIHNEDSLYKLVLLENENFKAIQKKYTKYMYQLNDDADSTLTYAAAAQSLVYDLICQYESDSAEFVSAATGVKLEVTETPSEEIIASNGKVLKFQSGVNVRIKNNKIKEVIIQGEDYLRTRSNDHTFVRLREHAMGGRDVMFIGRALIPAATSSWVVNDTIDGRDTTYTHTYPSGDKAFSYTSATNDGSLARCGKDINSYLEYRPHLYSCSYEVYWMSNNDIAGHYAGDTLDFDFDPNESNKPCASVYRCVMKMYIGEEGKNLVYGVDNAGVSGTGYIANYKKNGSAKVMAGIPAADIDLKTPVPGVNAGVIGMEQQLIWYGASEPYQALGSPIAFRYDPKLPMRPAKDYLNIKNECDIDIFVTNSPEADDGADQNNGMMFLDYIRFVPVIAEDE